MYLTKDKGKHLPITITAEVRKQITAFKERLKQMADQPDETSEFDAKTIHIILNELDDYDSNLLIAYYAVADCSPTVLGNLLGLSSSVAGCRVKAIQTKIKKLNNAPKTADNHTRMHYDPDEWIHE